MEKIFFVVLVLAILKYLLSVFFISKNLKTLSYLTDLLFSTFIFYITYDYTLNIPFTFIFFITEYLLNKLLVLITIIIKKEVAFRLLISITHDTKFSKILCIIFNKYRLCRKLRKTKSIKYGPELKHGISSMANRTHKQPTVPFDRNGFPKFKAYASIKLHPWDYKKSRDAHFNKANKILYKKALKSQKIRNLFTKSELEEFKKGITPDKYTWHHHQNRGKMQLVSYKTHATVNHIGGYHIWGGKP